MKFHIIYILIVIKIFAFEYEEHEVLSTWKYKNGKFVLESENKDSRYRAISNIDKERELIELVEEFYTDALLKRYVDQLVVYSDGIDNNFAYVESIEGSNNKKWSIYLDIQDSYNHTNGLYHKYFFETLVHEYFHILSLNYTQVDFSGDNPNTFMLYEGSSYEDSYINQFYQRFWKKGQITNYLIELDYSDTDTEEKEMIRLELYDKYSNLFVNDYAMSNPIEDIAESFTYYVFEDNYKRGHKVKDKKLAFFDNYRELRDLKKHFKKATQDNLARKSKRD